MHHTVPKSSRAFARAAVGTRPAEAGLIRGMLAWGGLLLLFVLLNTSRVAAHEISDFLGRYSGSVEVSQPDGSADLRDMSVVISETQEGFIVRWSTTTEKGDGRRKEKSYDVEFIPSDRSGIFSAAMQRNVFGHEVQQDPMKGLPYVWARLTGDTLTVFSMFIHQNGDYEMQQYDRSLTESGLSLVFVSHRNGIPVRRIETDLLRQ
ncbi:MAG: hypothetical protein ABJP44_02280 [Sulfitobacter sp.]|uniref:hypothetical protein n=1 Tax=Sulfitobacter sp. TaxID=1903071 RepID=UPI003297E0D5